MYMAVGYKGWVEVRRASAPLKIQKSVITLKPAERAYVTYDPERNRGVIVHKMCPKSVPITTVTGGRVLHTIPSMTFWRILGFQPRVGSCRKLTTEQYNTLKSTVNWDS